MSKKGESHVSCDRMSLGSLCTDGPPVAIRQEFSESANVQREKKHSRALSSQLLALLLLLLLALLLVLASLGSAAAEERGLLRCRMRRRSCPTPTRTARLGKP